MSASSGRPALTCITSPEDAAELEADKEAPAMPVRGVGFIPRYTFYVGIDEKRRRSSSPFPAISPATESAKPFAERVRPFRRKARI